MVLEHTNSNELINLLKSDNTPLEQKAMIIEELVERDEIVLDRVEYLH